MGGLENTEMETICLQGNNFHEIELHNVVNKPHSGNPHSTSKSNRNGRFIRYEVGHIALFRFEL